jgi:hypothetical protein
MLSIEALTLFGWLQEAIPLLNYCLLYPGLDVKQSQSNSR